jgi:hypothetical protein
VPGENDVPISAKLKNSLSGFTREELLADVGMFAKEKDLEHIIPLLKKGALVAQNPKKFEEIEELDDIEREWLRQEKTHRWNQPKMLYFMPGKSLVRIGVYPLIYRIVLCAGSAIVQGIDQTVVNGA